jgi:hypothetical protein
MSIHLPDKSSYNSLVIEDLERQDRIAGLVRGVVELEGVISHSNEAEMIIPVEILKHFNRFCSRSSPYSSPI